jgi:hypothetical protein
VLQEISIATSNNEYLLSPQKNEETELYSKPIIPSDKSTSDATVSTNPYDQSEHSDHGSASSPKVVDNRDEYIEFLISEESLFWLNHPPEESERTEEGAVHHECSAATCRLCEAKRQRGPAHIPASTTAPTTDDDTTPVKRRSPAYEHSCRDCIVDDTVEL